MKNKSRSIIKLGCRKVVALILVGLLLSGIFPCSVSTPAQAAGNVDVTHGKAASASSYYMPPYEPDVLYGIETIGDVLTVTITVGAKFENDVGATAAVTQVQMREAFDMVVAEALKDGGNKGIGIKIKVNAPVNIKSVATGISMSSAGLIADNGVVAFTVSTSIASITFDKQAITAIYQEAAGDIRITASWVKASTLSESAKQLIGGRPVFSLNVAGGGRDITRLSGSMAIMVPYTPGPGENTDAIVIYRLNSGGKPELVRECMYDNVSGRIRFKTSHFPLYAVGCNKSGFADVSGWYAEYVGFLEARDVIHGKGENLFVPQANISRAEFAQMLANMAGADPGKYTASAFRDVQTSDWYAGAVQWAYENGIVFGAENRFEPASNITRQDMAVMTGRYIEKAARFTLPQTGKEINFSDSALISDYAKAEVKALQQAGIISGRDDNKLDPLGNTTRAEAAKVLAMLLQSMIK